MKIRKILIFLAAAALCLNFTACGDGSQTEESGQYKVVINDFEDYKNCFQTLDLLNYFGRAERNTQAEYVHGGEASLKMTPLRDRRTNNTPVLRQYMKILSDGRYCDFGKVENLLFYAYNASDSDCSIYVRPAFNGFEADIKEFPLKKGEWTLCVYSITEKLETTVDVSKCYYIDFLLDRPADDSQNVEVYLDDLTLTVNTEKTPALGSYKPKVETDSETGAKIYELNYFDSLEALSHVLPYAAMCTPDIAPELSANTDLAYADGHEGMSLKVVAPATPENSAAQYPGFEFSKLLMDDSVVATGDPEKGDYISCRVYNANPSDQGFELLLGTRGGSRIISYGFTAKAMAWTTVTLTYEWMNNNIIWSSIDAIDEFAVSWTSFSGDARTFYFDSFRIVKFA